MKASEDEGPQQHPKSVHPREQRQKRTSFHYSRKIMKQDYHYKLNSFDRSRYLLIFGLLILMGLAMIMKDQLVITTVSNLIGIAVGYYFGITK